MRIGAHLSDTDSWELSRILQLAVEEKFPTRHHCRDEVLLELLTSLVIANPRIVDRVDLSSDQREEQARKFAADDTLWRMIAAVLDPADQAVTRYPADGPETMNWDYPSPSSLNGRDRINDSTTMDSLSECAAQYCKSQWAKSPTLEQWLARQLIFAETYAFSRNVGIPIHYKSFKFWWMWTKSLAKWLIGLGVAFTVGDSHGPAVGVLTYVAWLAVVRYLAQDQIDQLLQLEVTFGDMRSAYVLALRSPPCPVEVEKSLSIAEGHKAVWPAGLRGLVEMAIARNRAVWL